MNGLLTILTAIDTPTEVGCVICNQEYGKAGPAIETHLQYLGQLPGAFRRLFAQHTLEAVRTPCGHVFCTYCIGVWLLESESSTCPLCRALIQIPAETYDENVNVDMTDPGVEGLAISLHVSSPIAAEIYDILHLSTRQLLTCGTPMPFVWYTEAMISDLPKLMVNIARRFQYQSIRASVPSDLPYMKLHNPIDRSVGRRHRGAMDLKYFSRADAPLTQHADAHRLYGLLCTRIEALKGEMGDENNKCLNWEAPMELLSSMVNEEMLGADGGVGQKKWNFYVRCVLKGLLVWQAYCEQVQQLSARRLETAHVVADEDAWRLSIE